MAHREHRPEGRAHGQRDLHNVGRHGGQEPEGGHYGARRYAEGHNLRQDNDVTAWRSSQAWTPEDQAPHWQGRDAGRGQGQGAGQGRSRDDFGSEDYRHRGSGPGGQDPYGNYGDQDIYDGRQASRHGGHGHRDGNEDWDPHYRRWRADQERGLDEDYRAWRDASYKKFSDEFSTWRGNRQKTGVRGAGGAGGGNGPEESAGGHGDTAIGPETGTSSSGTAGKGKT